MRVGTDIPVLFEDNHCLAVNKPARLLVASDKTGDETLLALCRDYVAAVVAAEGRSGKGFVAPLHFIDRPVSGVVLFAKSSKAASRLSEEFRSRRMDKVYRAVVEGVPSPAQATIHDHLVKDHDANVVRVSSETDQESKACTLEYKTLASDGQRSLLEILPHTGRSHQIRVQLSTRGWPICGDTKYGARQSHDGWIALHAFRLTFAHPITKEPLTVAAPLPDSWSKIPGFPAISSREA